MYICSILDESILYSGQESCEITYICSWTKLMDLVVMLVPAVAVIRKKAYHIINFKIICVHIFAKQYNRRYNFGN